MLTLYHYPPSAPSRAAVLVSKLLGIDIDIHILDLKKKQHLKPDFLNINPQHTVPTLVDGDFVLWDSHAIAMYLADTYSKDETFYPKEPKYRARINQRLNFDCGTLYPAIRKICFPIIWLDNDIIYENERLLLNDALGFLDIFIGNNDFVVGNHLTIADCSLVASVSSILIVELVDIRGVENSVVLVMEYLPCSLSDVIRYVEKPITLAQTKTYIQMCLSGVSYMHNNHIMHRDLKPSNLLISHSGILKIADFGLARIYKKTDLRTYSHQVATRWYRAPELLYGSRTYTPKVDIWSVGCILGEMIHRKPLFPGETDIEQLAIVLGTLGTPDEIIWPGVTSLPDYNKISFSHTSPKSWKTVIPDGDKQSLNIIATMLQYNEAERPSAEEVPSIN
ncbi:hypothetical protein WA026_019096 [Henosepilachna vigintioctopunctata]|uniref:Cyclin-dependent kinase 20 n=1 Tax=Henosepilachna vigintioctopunctata TaxID=420089 RepID=A0AAW1VEH3_9CUCU